HRRLTFFTAPAGVVADNDRLETFLARTAELGVRPHPVETELNLDAAGARTLELLRSAEPPTAIITNSDFTAHAVYRAARQAGVRVGAEDRKSTRLNSSHVSISYAVFCLKKKRRRHTSVIRG